MAEPAEEPTPPAAETTGSSHGSSKRLHSSHSSGMESSVLRFKDVNFIVGKKDKQKNILSDVSGTVKWGHVLAVMGPSGAGKTTLISALTLDAFYGTPTGSVTLNGVPMTDHIFKNHCYVVVQHDKHWPYLTCRETLKYAAELYDVATSEDIDAVVDEIVTKMGLNVCVDTRNARLSGGQRRRLSIGIALLKQPTLLFLDEPTSGLDAAAAENIMQEVVRVAKEERLIILCTIHQPSTKVYNGFDQIMILSKGREAFAGDVGEATPYFESIGYPLPVQTNPAEHFLDLVNADFSDDAEVDKILDTWEEKKPGGGSSSHHKKGFADADNDEDAQTGVTEIKRAGVCKEMSVMFRRHFAIIIRDPILYIGRCGIFLVSNLIFALVYLNARDYDQDQAQNKLWVSIWFIGVPSNMGVVAVYALNDEFKTVIRETKNGMVRPISYVIAKFFLVLPIMFIFGIFALVIPAFAIIDFPWDALGWAIILFAAIIYVFECVAECLSVWFDDPILGMMQFMNFWFGSFLFGGFLISQEDLFWPFELFYYIMPFGYYLRSSMYNFLEGTTWSECTDLTTSAICANPPTGKNVLSQMSRIFGIVDDEDTIAQDLGIMIAIAMFWKIFYIVGVVYKGAKVAKIHPAPGAAAE